MDVLAMVGVNCMRAASSMLMNACMTRGPFTHTHVDRLCGVMPSHGVVVGVSCTSAESRRQDGLRICCRASADRRAGPT